MKQISILFLSIFILISCTIKTEDDPNNDEYELYNGLYFPPNGSDTWVSISTSDAGFNESNLNDLYTYLEEKDSKGFIVLKEGKIVIEKYFNGHSKDTDWIWYSAAKTLTATSIGIAQQEGLIDIDNKTSAYLGNNWTSLSIDKENLIKVKHQLTMTTGLVSDISDLNAWVCTLPSCLEYNVDAGTVWTYHQAPYTLLQDVITQSSGVNFESYFNQKIQNKIGMEGDWFPFGQANLYTSTSRDMARFGLLMLNKGTWKDEMILNENYFNEMTTTSQDLNHSYGYLWWLNGKDSFIGTDTQPHAGSIVPNAPSDMIAALGANDQKIYVVDSKKLVVIRCGNSAGNAEFANSSFDNELWEKINAVINN